MITPAFVTSFKSDRAGKAIVPLLALLIFLNYVDRGSLNITALVIKDQLHFSATQIGILLSAVFLELCACANSHRLDGATLSYCAGDRCRLALWTLATAGMGMATGFLSFLMFRLLLGVGESVAFPCSSKLLAQLLPLDRLGRAGGCQRTLSAGCRFVTDGGDWLCRYCS